MGKVSILESCTKPWKACWEGKSTDAISKSWGCSLFHEQTWKQDEENDLGKPGSVQKAEMTASKHLLVSFFFFLQILIRHVCQLPTKSKRDQHRHICDRTWNWVAIAIAAFAELYSDWAAHMGLMAQQTWTGCFRSQTATAPGCYPWGRCTKGGVSKAGAVLWFGYFFEMFARFQLSGELILRNLDFNLL